MANARVNRNSPASATNQFSLLPAIFTPFHGVPEGQKSLISRDEKLRRILETLDQHQDAVRQNMMFLVAKEKERLIEEAKEALRLENERTGRQIWNYDKDVDEPDEQEIWDLLERLRAPVREDVDMKEYEYKDEDLSLDGPRKLGGTVDVEGDAKMGGTENPSRGALIRANLDTNLRNLVIRAATEMKNYDAHADQTKHQYQQALLRNSSSEWSNSLSSEAAPAVVSAGGPGAAGRGGILSNRNAEIFIDTEALARMATDPSNSPVQARKKSLDMRDTRRW